MFRAEYCVFFQLGLKILKRIFRRHQATWDISDSEFARVSRNVYVLPNTNARGFSAFRPVVPGSNSRRVEGRSRMFVGPGDPFIAANVVWLSFSSGVG